MIDIICYLLLSSGDKERIGHVKIHPQPQIIHVAERPDPVVRLAMKVDQLKIFVDRVRDSVS